MLQDFKEHHTDNHERKGKRQHKLIDSEPADVDGWIRKQESTSHLAVVERHQASVYKTGVMEMRESIHTIPTTPLATQVVRTWLKRNGWTVATYRSKVITVRM